MKDHVYRVMAATIGPLLARQRSLRILMYHNCPVRPVNAGDVPADLFRLHMAYLAGQGYRSCRLCDVLAQWPQIVEGPPTVAIAFDDGWATHRDIVLPVLQEHGFLGTFFIATDFVGSQRVRPSYGPMAQYDAEVCCWDDLEALVSAGMEIGAHTHTHRRLSQIAPQEMENEVASPRRILASRLGCPVVSMAYPHGDRRSFSDQVVQAVAQAGYQVACTSIWGCPTAQSDLLRLPRIDINGLDDPARFTRKMKGHYDFIRWIRWWR